MSLEELVRIDPNDIRRDKKLMQLFIEYYEAAFSFLPKCVGCSFKSSFKKLKRYVITGKKNVNFDKNTIDMKSFVLKKEYLTKILTFKDSSGKTKRKYGYQMTEDFAKGLVDAGKGNVFSTLPEVEKKPIAIINDEGVSNSENLKDGIDKLAQRVRDKLLASQGLNKYDVMDYRKEVLPLYSEAKERTGNKAKSNKKVDIIKFLQDNEG